MKYLEIKLEYIIRINMIINKFILFADDKKIKDPYILDQMR